MARQVSDSVQSVVEPAVTALGYELVGIEFVSQGRHSVLRVYIDDEDGITLEDCERVSHQVSGALDVEDPIRGQYSLEVSSPGLDRPLFTEEHFTRFAGQEVRVRLTHPLEGRRKFRGRLVGVSDGEVVVIVDGEEKALPFEDIESARLVPDV